MSKRIGALAGVLCLITSLSACKKDEPAPAPEPAAKSEPVKETPKAEPPEKAANPAQEYQKAIGAMAKAAQAAQQAQASGQGQGKVVNWRQLAAFLPDKLGDFAADGEVDGKTANAMGMQISTVKRKYKQADKKLRVEIVDTNLVPMMRAGMAMALTINEDSSTGLKRGTKVEGQPGLLEWRKANKRGKLSLVAGDRFLMTLRLTPTDDPQAVVKLAESMDLKKLAALKAE